MIRTPLSPPAGVETVPTTVSSDPPPEPKTARQPGRHADMARCLHHPRELALRGIPVRCPACQAQRDWLLLFHRRDVWIVCRCSHTWHEPELRGVDFNNLVARADGTDYASVTEGLSALGFDGLLTGAYIE